MLFRRYSADLTPLLTYVVHQLQNGQTTELVVIRELIWKIAGIEPLPSLSDSQVLAMAGGPTLRIEAVASNTRGARLDPREAKYGALGRLGKSLLDSSLALPLLVQVAQQRQSCVFQAPDAHPKSLASLFDTVRLIMVLPASPSIDLYIRRTGSCCNTWSFSPRRPSSPLKIMLRRLSPRSQSSVRSTVSARRFACRSIGLF